MTLIRLVESGALTWDAGPRQAQAQILREMDGYAARRGGLVRVILYPLLLLPALPRVPPPPRMLLGGSGSLGIFLWLLGL
jgi:hypothetical protein